MTIFTTPMKTRLKVSRVSLQVTKAPHAYELFIMENISAFENIEPALPSITLRMKALGIKYFETSQYVSFLFTMHNINITKLQDEISVIIHEMNGILLYSSLELLSNILANKNNKKTKITLEISKNAKFYFVTSFMTLSSPLMSFAANKILLSKNGPMSEISIDFMLNIKCPNNRVFEPLIERLNFKALLKKHEESIAIDQKIYQLLINVKPDILESLIEINNVLQSKQSYRYKVSSLVINNRLSTSVKIIYQQKSYNIEDEIRSLDVSSNIVKTDYNMDFIELIKNEENISSEKMIENFEAAIDRIELTEELKAISLSTENFGSQRKQPNNVMVVQISPEIAIDINLAAEGKFLAPLNDSEYKILVSVSVINGSHHIEIKPCLEIINKTSHKFYVVLFKKSHEKGLPRPSSLTAFNSDNIIDKPQLLATGSKRLKKDDIYTLPYMKNVDNYFIKICEHFDNTPNNVYSITSLLKTKSASVSTTEKVS